MEKPTAGNQEWYGHGKLKRTYGSENGGERKEETVGGLVSQSVSQSASQSINQSVSPLLGCCIYMSQDYILSIRKGWLRKEKWKGIWKAKGKKHLSRSRPVGCGSASSCGSPPRSITYGFWWERFLGRRRGMDGFCCLTYSDMWKSWRRRREGKGKRWMKEMHEERERWRI